MKRGEWGMVRVTGLCGGTVYLWAMQPSALSMWTVRVETGRELRVRAVERRASTLMRRLWLVDLALFELRALAAGGMK